jgi:hypothetical protein
MSNSETPKIPQVLESADKFQLAAYLASEISDQNDRVEFLLASADEFDGFEEFREEIEKDLAEEQKRTVIKFNELRTVLQNARVEEHYTQLKSAIAELDELIKEKQRERNAKIDAAVERAIATVPAQSEKYRKIGEELKARELENIAELQNTREELNDMLINASIIKGAQQTALAEPSPELWAQFPPNQFPPTLEEVLEPTIETVTMLESGEPDAEEGAGAAPEEPSLDEAAPTIEEGAEDEQIVPSAEEPAADLVIDETITPESTPEVVASEETVEVIPVDEARLAQDGVQKSKSEKARRAEEVNKRYLTYFVTNPRNITNADYLVDNLLFDDPRYADNRPELKNLVHVKLNPGQGGGKAMRRELAQRDFLLQRGTVEYWQEYKGAYSRAERVYRSIRTDDYDPSKDDGETTRGKNKYFWETIELPPGEASRSEAESPKA